MQQRVCWEKSNIRAQLLFLQWTDKKRKKET